MKHLRWWIVGVVLAAGLVGCGMQRASDGQDTTTASPPAAPAAMAGGIVNIVDYGAVGDGRTTDTQAIQKAIDTCAAAGGGRVLVPAGIYLTGPIVLRSYIDLHLNFGATISFSANRDDYPMMLGNFEGKQAVICQSPLSGEKLQYTSITGEGIFDGSGQVWRPSSKSKMPDKDWSDLVASGGVVEKTKDEETQKKDKTWWPTQAALDGHDRLTALRKDTAPPKMEDYAKLHDLLRPPLVMLTDCHHLTLEGPTFQNSPSWTIHLLACKNVLVRNIVSYNPSYGRNTDGIDIDSCSDVTMTGCTVNSGDDDICLKSGKDEEGRRRGIPTENITISDCTIGWGHGGIAIGSEMSGGVRNVNVSNCIIKGPNVGLRFKSRRGRGGVVENIQISNITMSDIKTAAIGFDLYYMDKETKPQPVGEGTPVFRNISIHNVSCRGAKQAIDIHGLPEMPLSDITLDKVFLTADNGAAIENVQNITLRDVEIHSAAAPAMALRNVSGLTTEQLTAQADEALPKLPTTRPTTMPTTKPTTHQE